MPIKITEEQFYLLLDTIWRIREDDAMPPIAVFDALTTPGDGSVTPSPIGEDALYRVHCWATDNR